MARSVTVTFREPRWVELVESEVPAPGPGQVVVETLASLISTGTELTAYSGEFPSDGAWARYLRYPFTVGYSNVGRVVATGEGVLALRPGDRVASLAPHATHAVLNAAECALVPAGLSDEEATFWTLGYLVMNSVRLAEISLGEGVVIIGAGLLGQLATGLAALAGAWPLVVVDVAEERLSLAARRGATHTVPATAADAQERVQEIMGGEGADVVFEVTGHPAVVAPALRLARRRGRVILLGSARGPSTVDFHDEVHTLGLQIIGAHASTAPRAETPYNRWTNQRNGALFLDLVAARRMAVSDLVSHRYSYRDAAAAYDFLLADRSRAMGVILTYRQQG